MRFSFIILSATFLIAACNSKPKAEAVIVPPTDSIAVADQATLNELPDEVPVSTSVVVKKPAATSKTTTSEVKTTETANEAQAKTGWSKTAKGAVVGAVVGAGTGAVVNKKNRAAGAVIGGAVGAGAGAVIGNEMDKKDGRH